VLPQAAEPLRALQSAQTSSEVLKKQNIHLFTIFCEGDGLTFLLKPPKRENGEMHPADNIAVLNRDTSNILSEIATFCTFEAYSSSGPWALIAGGTTTNEKNTYILVDVILYGRQIDCREVGEILTAKRVYLQEPDYWQPGLGYNNPHFLDLSAVHPEAHTTLDPLRSSLLQMDVKIQSELSEAQAATHALLKQKIAMAFKNMTRAQNLKRIAADIRIRTLLLP